MRMKLLSMNVLSKKSSLTLMLATLLLVTLAGCSSDGEKRPEYMDATTLESLEIPPKLSIPDTRGALELPEPAKTAPSPGDCNVK